MWRCFFVTHLFPRVYRLLFVACARSSPLLRGVRLGGWPGVDWDFFCDRRKVGMWRCFFCHAFVSARLSLAFCSVRAQLPVGRENYQLASIRAKKKRAPLTREGARGDTRGGTRPARADERPIQRIKSNARKDLRGTQGGTRPARAGERPIQFIKSNTRKGLRGANARCNS